MNDAGMSMMIAGSMDTFQAVSHMFLILEDVPCYRCAKNIQGWVSHILLSQGARCVLFRFVRLEL